MISRNLFSCSNFFKTMLVVFSITILASFVLCQIIVDESVLVDEWLDQNELGEYKQLFREHGK